MVRKGDKGKSERKAFKINKDKTMQLKERKGERM
jgi:hypothetical protein